MCNSLVNQATPRLRSAQRFDSTHALSHLALRPYLARASWSDTSPVPFRTRLTAPAPQLGSRSRCGEEPDPPWTPVQTARCPIDDCVDVMAPRRANWWTRFRDLYALWRSARASFVTTREKGARSELPPSLNVQVGERWSRMS